MSAPDLGEDIILPDWKIVHLKLSHFYDRLEFQLVSQVST